MSEKTHSKENYTSSQPPEERSTPEKESKLQEKFENLQQGKEKIVSEVLDNLESSSKRPQIVFINGEAGAGKSFLSEQVRNDLDGQNTTAIFIETDMYHEEEGVEIYTHADFANQKQAWENGQRFEYFNPQSGQKEMVDGSKLDVLIIGGIGATKETGLNPTIKAFIKSPFINRLANKGLRDNIINAQGKVGIDRFMDEIANPEPGQDYLAHAFEQEIKSKKIANESDILITNTHENSQSKIWLEGITLKFKAEYRGDVIEAERDLSTERFKLLQKIININNPETASKFEKKLN